MRSKKVKKKLIQKMRHVYKTKRLLMQSFGFIHLKSLNMRFNYILFIV